MVKSPSGSGAMIRPESPNLAWGFKGRGNERPLDGLFPSPGSSPSCLCGFAGALFGHSCARARPACHGLHARSHLMAINIPAAQPALHGPKVGFTTLTRESTRGAALPPTRGRLPSRARARSRPQTRDVWGFWLTFTPGRVYRSEVASRPFAQSSSQPALPAVESRRD
jgi:hypothetical protein